MLYIKLKYNMDLDIFTVDTNIKHKKLADVISGFVRTQIGKGSDESEINDLSVYTITLYLNLSTDKFTVKHDCGNEGLMLGIVMQYLDKLRNNVVDINIGKGKQR